MRRYALFGLVLVLGSAGSAGCGGTKDAVKADPNSNQEILRTSNSPQEACERYLTPRVPSPDWVAKVPGFCREGLRCGAIAKDGIWDGVVGNGKGCQLKWYPVLQPVTNSEQQEAYSRQSLSEKQKSQCLDAWDADSAALKYGTELHAREREVDGWVAVSSSYSGDLDKEPAKSKRFSCSFTFVMSKAGTASGASIEFVDGVPGDADIYPGGETAATTEASPYGPRVLRDGRISRNCDSKAWVSPDTCQS